MISISLRELGGQVGKARWVRTEFLCMYHRWPKSTRHFFGFLSTLFFFFFFPPRREFFGWGGRAFHLWLSPISPFPFPRSNPHDLFSYLCIPPHPGLEKQRGGRRRASHSLSFSLSVPITLPHSRSPRSVVSDRNMFCMDMGGRGNSRVQTKSQTYCMYSRRRSEREQIVPHASIWPTRV